MSVEIDQRDIFLRGKSVILKVLTRDDALESGWYGWFNDEALCQTLQKHYYPNSREMQVEFWEQNVKGATNKIQLGICRVGGGPIIGVISLNNIDFINRKAELSVVIGDSQSRNLAIFVESCELLINHAFYTLNLNRVYGGSISEDLVDLMCRVLKCKREGVLRQEVYKNGQYKDGYLYSVLCEEFPRLADLASSRA